MFDIVQQFIFLFFAFYGFLKILNFYRKKKKINFYEVEEISSLISIIIPCRNEEKRLKTLLSSLQEQTYKNYEVIVVDDNSTDNTIALAKEYKARVFEVKDFYKDEEGKSIACYVGAINAKGDYLLFLDADVFLKKNALEYVTKHFPTNSILTIQPYHKMYHFYEQFSLFSNLIVILGLDAGNFKNSYETKRGFFGPFMMIKKENYFRVGGHLKIKETIIEDMALGLLFLKNGIKIYTIPHEMLIFFRMYPEGFFSLFNGWMKNMVLGARRSGFLTILTVTGIVASSFIIPISLIKMCIYNNFYGSIFYAVLYFIFSIMLYITSRKTGNFKFLSCLLFPVFALFFVVVFLSSLFVKIFSFSINWRGRKVKVK